MLQMRNKATCSATSLDGSVILFGFTDNRIRAWQPRAENFPNQVSVTEFASSGGMVLAEESDSDVDSLPGLGGFRLQRRESRSVSPKRRPLHAGVSRLRHAVLSSANSGLGLSPANSPAGSRLSRAGASSAGSQLATVANMMRVKANFKRAQQRRHDFEHVSSAFRSYGAENTRIDTLLRMPGRASSDEADEASALGIGEEEEDDDGEVLESHGLFRSADLHAGEVQNLSISHDGALVISVANGAIRVWDTATGKVLQSIGRRVGYGDVRIAVFSPRYLSCSVRHCFWQMLCDCGLFLLF